MGEVGEFGLIARITARLPPAAATLLGPGDDAAVLRAPDGRVVATTDLLVEGRHFRRDWSTAYDVGRKAAAQNLADIAAMGAVPTALLVGLVLPSTTLVRWCEQLADGLRDEAAVAGAVVVGGDITRGDAVVVAVTALGDLGGRPPVLRSGARPGHRVVLIGRLGYAAAGLAVLATGDPRLVDRHPAVVDAHRRPKPEYAAARVLAEAGASAMVDVSDGLGADAGHLAAAAGVAVELFVADLPVAPVVAAAARDLGVDPLPWVQAGGDDHAFVATLPPDATPQALSLLTGLGTACRLVEVGRVLLGQGVRWVGGPAPPVAGHDHFATD